MAGNPKALYQETCAELKIKCNSAVLQQLPAEADHFTSWDLSGNLVGTKGAAAILRVASVCPNLESLNLRGNNLGSAVTKDILGQLVRHPKLRSINLADNDIRLGGPELIELLKKNRRITALDITNTHLRPLFVRLIAIQLNKNNGKKPEGDQPAAAGRFSFGAPADAGGDDGFAAGEEEAFSAFSEALRNSGTHKHVGFESGAHGGGRIPPRRPTVCAEVYREDEIDNFVPEVVPKDPKTRQWLMSVLERHDLFSHLEDYELFVAVDAMQECTRKKGDVVFDEEDEEDGDVFYVIASGELELKHKGEHLDTLKKGSTTQDLMLLYAQRPRETGVCESDVTLYSLDRRTYKCILSKASKKKRAMYAEFLASVPFLKSLSNGERLQLADALKPAQFEPGQSLIRYGEVGETFYIIVEGTVEVFGRDDSNNPIKVCEFTRGENVGELEFINNHKCVADVKAKDAVRVAKMNRHHFEMVMGPVKEVLARTANESTVYAYYRDQLEKMEKDKKH